MSLTYQQIAQIVGSGGAGAAPQMAVAVARAAVTVLSEDPVTANHAARLAWAQKTLADVPAMATKMGWAVLHDATIQEAWPEQTDEQVQAAVDGLVDGFLNA